MDKRFNDLILAAIKQRISDLHITGGYPLIFRRDGVIHSDKNMKWTHTEIDKLVKEMLSDRQLFTLRKRWSVDFAMSLQEVRIRINAFYTTRGLSLAIRLLPETIPDVNALNLHPSLNQIRDLRAGMVLVCGSTGSGKSTTVAAIIEEINRTRPVHIITIEDPIEYRFKPKKAFIEQREVGIHVPSFEQGLLDSLRENPDVIFVGELRDPDTIKTALTAAESGHLVFGTLHATDAEDAIYRINNCVSGEGQEIIRYQFASSFSWLIIQQLIHIEKAGFRVPVLSILRGSSSVRSSIRENKLTQLETIMHTGRNEGMFTMELYRKEFIDRLPSFNHPYKSFGMGADSSKEKDYVSSLIDPNAVQNVVYTANLDDALIKPEDKRKEDDWQQYVVLEDHDVDLKDIFEQYDHSDNRFNSNGSKDK
ncbi:MAG TPA: PilT/PilU family type 4a pilus ATPase [Smithellaceae bacterium]|nr:PilT/PilU family type 4a pilus ATPase [Smithellaceae bacterium]HOE23003.1 PilT/PilU family type 4a pilus ATPase [Smithellaceae bacterium]HOH57771.1 PilT/PilU family type 4a pilus ATPase [Smithellaceae bacterium]HPL32817.1 PilT/PilU family type 4a pilus ATPase [Smithellaceae bacterium]HQC10841.1 PilT/PilU family type 4a pilus ATPase [Smithellaceae bacterium]